MSPDIPTDRAVIDRIADGVAVLLVGVEGTACHLDVASLPEGAAEGDVVKVEAGPGDVEVDAELTVGAIDHELTAARRRSARSRRSRIRQERSSGRFD